MRIVGHRRCLSIAFLAVWAWARASPAETGAAQAAGPGKAAEAPDLLLKQYWPRSMLRLPTHPVVRARFPVIDMHQHVNSEPGEPHLPPEEVVAIMNETNVETAVILTGGWGDKLQRTIDEMVKPYPGRFVVLTQIDWSRVDEPDFGEAMAAQIRDSVARGARGLKFIKSFGLGVRRKSGKLVELDDPGLDPIWRECARLGIPVAIHTADPDAFWLPLDASNERYEELKMVPRWHHFGANFPTKEALFEARSRLFARHPQTTFIALHIGMGVEDLDAVGEMLRRHPNVYVEFGAQQAELGRQPRRARRFFIEFQNRIMFGTDFSPMTREGYRSYFRWLETDDEHFDYYNAWNQGRWRIYGLDLPDQVLEKVYHSNAKRILGGFPGSGSRSGARTNHAAYQRAFVYASGSPDFGKSIESVHDGIVSASEHGLYGAEANGWLEFDLGLARRIEEVRVGVNADGYYATDRWSVDVLNDRKGWRRVSTSSGEVIGMTSQRFAPVTARFVRVVVGQKLGRGPHNIVALYEVEIWGPEPRHDVYPWSPTNLRFTPQGDDRHVLSWDPAPGAVEYVVRRGSLTLAGRTRDTFLAVTSRPGNLEVFEVTARNEHGNFSPNHPDAVVWVGNPAAATNIHQLRPVSSGTTIPVALARQPGGFRPQYSNTGPDWQTSTYAETGEGAHFGSALSPLTIDLERICIVSGTEWLDAWPDGRYVPDIEPSTAYDVLVSLDAREWKKVAAGSSRSTRTSFPPESARYVRLAWSDGNSHGSEYFRVEGHPKYQDESPPSPPANLRVAVTRSGARVSWDPAVDAESGVIGYRIYRNGLRVSRLITTATDPQTYEDARPAEARTRWTVRAVNGAGIEGPDRPYQQPPAKAPRKRPWRHQP